MDTLINELTLDHIPEGLYKEIAVNIGIENLYKLCCMVGGVTIYLPKPDSLTRPIRDTKIREEFNGYNHPDLAKKYNVTERWVRQLCGEGHMEGQVNIFELGMNDFADDTERINTHS